MLTVGNWIGLRNPIPTPTPIEPESESESESESQRQNFLGSELESES